jgi:hypothetical protein
MRALRVFLRVIADVRADPYSWAPATAARPASVMRSTT